MLIKEDLLKWCGSTGRMLILKWIKVIELPGKNLRRLWLPCEEPGDLGLVAFDILQICFWKDACFHLWGWVYSGVYICQACWALVQFSTWESSKCWLAATHMDHTFASSTTTIVEPWCYHHYRLYNHYQLMESIPQAITDLILRNYITRIPTIDTVLFKQTAPQANSRAEEQ